MKTTITFILIIVFLGIAFLINSIPLATLAGVMTGIRLCEAIFGIEICN